MIVSEESMEITAKKGLNASRLKLIAIIAMTIDHLAWVIWPGYERAVPAVIVHCIGRITAPIMWYFIAEGYRHTRSVKRYAVRLFVFAVISHFAYTFAFGIPAVPFKETAFNQTSVMWALFWGLIALHISGNEKLKDWQKICLIIIICAVSFSADWSCIAVMAIVYIGEYHGDFEKQMRSMMVFVVMYAAVYALFIDWMYGLIQLCVAFAIPLLRAYNGQRGGTGGRGMKWLFYVYYPLHLVICGIIRLMLHGNVGVMIGG